MRVPVRILLAVVMLTPWFAAHAIDPVGLDDPELDARYRTLIEELRCLVCQNQTLSESNAPLAKDLREQVREQVAAGATDDEVVAYLTARYGDFVLYRPPFNVVTAMLWLSPVLLLMVGGFAAWRVLRATPQAGSTLDESKRAQIRALLERGDGR